MPSKQRMKIALELDKNKKHSPEPPRRRKKSGDRSRPLDPFDSLQRAYGNAALARLAQSFVSQAEGETAVNQLKPPYNAAAERLIDFAGRDGKRDLLQQFLSMTPGQKLAVLQAMENKVEFLQGGQPDESDWEEVESVIRSIQGVRLEPDEVETEGDASETGAERSDVSVNVTGLLPPYKDMVLWLNYKGNKQGKPEILQAFNSLSIPHKKLAIHQMVRTKGKKLEFTSFTEALTVSVMQKQWVDWEAVVGAVRKSKEIDIEKLPPQEKEALFSHDVAAMKERDEDEDRGSGGSSLLGMLGAAVIGSVFDEEKAEEEREKLPSGVADDNVGRLLLGLAGPADAVEVISNFLKQRPDRNSVVDRYLQIPSELPPKAREKARELEAVKRGFRTIEQCYIHIMNELSQLIFNKGVIQEDKRFLRLIEEMGMQRIAGKSPQASEIAQKLLELR